MERLSIQLSLSEGNRFRSGQEHDWKPFRDENGGIKAKNKHEMKVKRSDSLAQKVCQEQSTLHRKQHKS